MKVSEWEKLIAREFITKYMPYYLYEDGVYITKDGGFGIIFECQPLSYIYQDYEAGMQTFLSAIPENASVQFFLFASPDISEQINLFKSLKIREGELAKEIVESYTEFLRKKTTEPITDIFRIPVRSYKLLISVKIGGKKKVYNFWDNLFSKFLGKQDENIEEEKTDFYRVKDLIYSLKSALFQAGFSPEICEPSRLIEILYPLFHMNKDFENKPWWDGGDISECMIDTDFKLEVKEDYVIINGVYGKSLCVNEYPQEWSFKDSFFYIGNPIYGKGISVPYVLCLNVIKPSDDFTDKIKTRASRVLGQKMPYALFPRLRLKHEDYSYALEKLEKGEKPYIINLSVFIFAKDYEELKRAEGEVKAHFQSFKFRLEGDKYINHIVFLSNLPLGYDMRTHEFLGRGRAVFSENVIDLAPCFADYKIFGIPQLLFITPRGEISGFDLFSTGEGGYNGFVVGMTGSGKSVFLQYISLMYYLAGYKIRIIDIGGSYERFCKNFDGEYISVSLSQPMCVNPFSNIKDENMLKEYMEFLINLLLLMGGSKDKRTFDQQVKLLKSYLEDALKIAFLRSKQKEKIFNIDLVVETLEEINEGDKRVIDFIKALKPFTSEGRYGEFFNGVSEVDLSKQIVVIDNTHIEKEPDLMEVLLMVFTFHVSKEVYESGGDAKLICIIDEAHKFLRNPKIEIFVDQAYRRFRKDGASIIMGTQGFNDFMGKGALSDAGRAAVENSFWQMFLMQTSASKNALKNEKTIALTDWEEELMDETKTVKGHYSEVFIKTEKFSGKFRLVLDDFMKAMFFTDPKIRQRMKELVQKGYSYREAVEIIKKEHVGS